MPPELIAIIAAVIMSLGFPWNLRRDVAGGHCDIAVVHRDAASVDCGVAGLRERMARLEGLFEGFTRHEPPAPPA